MRPAEFQANLQAQPDLNSRLYINANFDRCGSRWLHHPISGHRNCRNLECKRHVSALFQPGSLKPSAQHSVFKGHKYELMLKTARKFQSLCLRDP